MEVREALWHRINTPSPLAFRDEASQCGALTQKFYQAPDPILWDCPLFDVPTLLLCLAVQYSHAALTRSPKPLTAGTQQWAVGEACCTPFSSHVSGLVLRGSSLPCFSLWLCCYKAASRCWEPVPLKCDVSLPDHPRLASICVSEHPVWLMKCPGQCSQLTKSWSQTMCKSPP